MNKRETMMILKILKIAYPVAFMKLTKEDMTVMLNLWHSQLKSYDSETVNRAVQYCIKDSKYMPAIADIVEQAKKNDALMIEQKEQEPIEVLRYRIMKYQELYKRAELEGRTPTKDELKKIEKIKKIVDKE